MYLSLSRKACQGKGSEIKIRDNNGSLFTEDCLCPFPAGDEVLTGQVQGCHTRHHGQGDGELLPVYTRPTGMAHTHTKTTRKYSLTSFAFRR